MRKLLAAFCLFLSTALLTVQTAQAANAAAADIFNSIGGTTTIDRGGAVHSQARSIYSLGGGMVSFQGKKVSLLSADAPSFSAGCNGISWHFGGFAFISLDEIRQLVEAVAQASLGVAVDLAMQTLCPQCYAVMAKLRDIANSMRNAAADACKIAQNFGAMLKDSGIIPSTNRSSDCSKTTAESGKTASFLDSWAGSACKLLSDAETELGGVATKAMDFLRNGKPASGTTPNREFFEVYGNLTYKALTALGYDDGPMKDVMLSLIGLTVTYADPSVDCKKAFRNLYASADSYLENASGLTAEEKASMEALSASKDPKKVEASSDTDAPKPTDATEKTPNAAPGGAVKGPNICNAPPILDGVKAVGVTLMCGFDAQTEMKTFARNYYAGDVEKLQKTSLGAMCNTVKDKDSSNPLVYTCRADSAECMEPKMARLADVMGRPTWNGYTGLAWMVGDALYDGVKRVRDNHPDGLADKTKKILNGSGWPLYRLINVAAVYPAMAGELLEAYTSAIAAQYVMDTLDKVSAIGAQPAIDLRSSKGLKPESISVVREHIMNMVRVGNEAKLQVLERLAEKRKMVEVIMQVNKTLQAEVIGQGLAGNANLAINIKRQQTTK